MQCVVVAHRGHEIAKLSSYVCKYPVSWQWRNVYNMPVSEVETLFLSADLASFVIAVSEMARV